MVHEILRDWLLVFFVGGGFPKVCTSTWHMHILEDVMPPLTLLKSLRVTSLQVSCTPQLSYTESSYTPNGTSHKGIGEYQQQTRMIQAPPATTTTTTTTTPATTTTTTTATATATTTTTTTTPTGALPLHRCPPPHSRSQRSRSGGVSVPQPL